MSNYRTQLETEKERILKLLEISETHGREQLSSRLREIVEQLNQLDGGTHWTQTIGDTQVRITLKDLQDANKTKVFRN